MTIIPPWLYIGLLIIQPLAIIITALWVVNRISFNAGQWTQRAEGRMVAIEQSVKEGFKRNHEEHQELKQTLDAHRMQLNKHATDMAGVKTKLEMHLEQIKKGSGTG